jgi:hypothetical protein
MTNTLVANALDTEAKFTDSQVTPDLREAGLTYLSTYEGDFSYLVDLKRRNPADLSVGQIRGILNCIRAQILRANNDKFWDGVAEGRYAVTVEGKLRFFRVNTPTEGRWSGFTFLTEMFGGGGVRAIKGVGPRNLILTAIANDPDALARFGQELGKCGKCGRDLTDEESRAIGIGPVCREQLGM